MPMVFLHGVHVRREPDPDAFDNAVMARDNMFRNRSLGQLSNRTLHVENPYWGKLASSFAYGLKSVPHGDEAFGGDDTDLLNMFIDPHRANEFSTIEGTQTFITLARLQGLESAVDAIVTGATVKPPSINLGNRDVLQSALVKFTDAALEYARNNPKPAWLFDKLPNGNYRLDDDSQFIETLCEKLSSADHDGGNEQFGMDDIVSWLKTTAQKVGGAVKAAANRAGGGIVGAVGGVAVGVAPEILRPALSRQIGEFVGDVFIYLTRRRDKNGNEGQIVSLVREAVKLAKAKESDEDARLILVGHSMGGVILYDFLTTFAPDLSVDLLLTVGSQVALFRELSLYEKNEGQPPQLVTRPANVAHWINVFDPMDILGFTTSDVFEPAVRSFEFSNQASLFNTHGMYFQRPTFHDRLLQRVREVHL